MSANDFPAAFAALIVNEGGYVDDLQDPGGATRYGVTERVARAHGYTGDMHDLPQSLAYSIAKAEYWDTYHCDDLPAEISFQVLDAAFNGGHPARWLQQACGVTVDGNIGPATVAAVLSSSLDRVVMRFDAYRLEYLAKLPTFPHFGAGWSNRIAANLLRAAGPA